LTRLETFTVKFVETAFQYICFVNRERFRRLMYLLRYLRFRACPSGCGAQYKICARDPRNKGFVTSSCSVNRATTSFMMMWETGLYQYKKDSKLLELTCMYMISHTFPFCLEVHGHS